MSKFLIPKESAERPRKKEVSADRLSIMAVWLLITGALVGEFLGKGALVSFGSFTLHASDPGIVLAAIATLANFARGKFSWPNYSMPIFLMTALIVINFLRGFAIDSSPALLFARANLGMVFLLMLALVAQGEQQLISAVRRALLISSALITVLALLRFASYPSLFMVLDTPDALINDDGRVLSAQGAFLLVLANGVLASEFLAQNRFKFDLLAFSVIALPILIFLTRQGTASIAAITMLIMILLAQQSRSRPTRIILVSFFGILISLGLVLLLPALNENANFIRRGTNLGTRQEIWASLMAIWPTQPISIQLFGYPAGQQPPLQVYWGSFYHTWGNSTHSMYYGALPIMGYAGLMSFIAMMLLLIGETLRRSLRRFNALPSYSLGLCIATATYAYAYEIRDTATLGLFLAILSLRAYSGAQWSVPKRQRARPESTALD